MRADVQAVFKQCPKAKQVMMFSATLGGNSRDVAKLYMNHV